MLLCVTAFLPASSQACACLCSYASFSPWFSQLFWFLTAAAVPSSSCKLQSCQITSLYFRYFLLTLFFPNRCGTYGCFDSKPDSWTLLPEFAAEWIQMLHSELCSTLNCKKHSIFVVFAFLFHSSENRGIMRRCIQTWRESKRIPMFTLATMFRSHCRPLTWSAPTFCTFQI